MGISPVEDGAVEFVVEFADGDEACFVDGAVFLGELGSRAQGFEGRCTGVFGGRLVSGLCRGFLLHRSRFGFFASRNFFNRFESKASSRTLHSQTT